MTTATRLAALAAGFSFLLLASPALAGAGIAAPAAFEVLKGMEGRWVGTGPADDGETATMVHVFRVSANGSVVMETMNPGTPHEMINMYHLDGDALVLTHYCAAGNQPHMRLSSGSTEKELIFDFAGGTNLDPAKDGHIHAARLTLGPDGVLHSSWTGWSNGKEQGTYTFDLARKAE